MMLLFSLLLVVPFLIIQPAWAITNKNTRRCIACHQLYDSINRGIERTKYEEGAVEDVGRIDSSGRHGKGSRKISYGTSEARLARCLTCDSNDHKPECYELVEDEVYYTPIRKWFTSGRKTPFLETICYSLIPGCTAKIMEKEEATARETKKKTVAKTESFQDRLVRMIPPKIREAPAVKKIAPLVQKTHAQASRLADACNKYWVVAARHARIYGKRFARNASVALDKVPVGRLIGRLPLTPRQAGFVERNWKLIVATLFVALLLPLYCLSCKGARDKTTTRTLPRSPLISGARSAPSSSVKTRSHKKAD